MPYLNPERRQQLRDEGCPPKTPGDLNYLFSLLVNDYLNEDCDSLSYQRCNDVIGALECCKMEVYRRIAAPYEDRKIIANGDVFDPEILGTSRGC